MKLAYALANTKQTSLLRAALAPADKSFEREVEMVADDPTNELIASIGGTINSRELEPEPHL